MIKVQELTEVQKNKLFGLKKCNGFWPETKGFEFKKTIYTVDDCGWIFITTNKNNGARLAAYEDIRKLFK